MREVISLNGEAPLQTRPMHVRCIALAMKTFTDGKLRTVGQAGCQIANSCWEVCLSYYHLLDIVEFGW